MFLRFFSFCDFKSKLNSKQNFVAVKEKSVILQYLKPEVGTVQNESNAVPVLGTCSKMYRGTDTRYYFKKVPRYRYSVSVL